MPKRHPLSILAGRARLMLSLLVAALIVVNASAGAKAPPTLDGVPFQTIRLPPEALSLPQGFARQRAKNQNPKLDSTVSQLASRARTSAVDAVGLAGAESLRVSGDKVYLQIRIRAGSLAGVVKAIAGAGGSMSPADVRAKLLTDREQVHLKKDPDKRDEGVVNVADPGSRAP